MEDEETGFETSERMDIMFHEKICSVYDAGIDETQKHRWQAVG